MSQLNESAEFVEKLQHTLDKPIQVLGNLRDGFISLREEVNNGNGPIDLEPRINEIISQARKIAPQVSEEFIKELLKIN